jgi:hypothetical protein
VWIRSNAELLFCKIAQAPLLVPKMLLLAVALDRVHSDLPAVVVGASSPLHPGWAAHQLPRPIFRREEILRTSSGIADRPYRRLSHAERKTFQEQDLETSIECGTASWPWLFFL